MSSNLMTNTLHLSYWDQVVLRRLLFRGQKRCLKDIERSEERGWQPEPGHVDISKETLKIIDSLLERIPDPGPIQVVTHVGGE